MHLLLLVLGALWLSGCTTIGPSVAQPEIETFEKALRAKSARFFIDQKRRLHVVGTRLLKALPGEDRKGSAPYLGLLAEEATEVLADAFGVPRREGVMVVAVLPEGPAARAGLQAGDYLEQIGPIAVTTPQDLESLVKLELAGPIPVSVYRDGMVLEKSIEPDRLPLNVEFKVVEDVAIDAFARPEAVTVTTGMLRFLRSDDELAIVVGHELAHLTRGHTLRRLGLNIPAVVLGVVSGMVVPGSQRLVTSAIEKLASNLIRGALTKVDRDMEREADVFGLLYTHSAGYDFRAGSEVWERFAVELPSSMTASLFATHPPSTERLIRLKKVTDALLSGVPPSTILEQLVLDRAEEEERMRAREDEERTRNSP